MSDEQQGSSFTHPLTEALHPDPDRFGERATVVGYPGPSPQAGRVRVYLDTTFTSYYELDESAVLSSVPATAGDENSPRVLVVAADASVKIVRVQTGQKEARFLAGSITSGHLAAATTGPTPDGCYCVVTTTFRTTLDYQIKGAANVAADCACAVASIVANTLAGKQAAFAPDCTCALASIVANTLAGKQAAFAPDCTCAVASIVANTLAGKQAAYAPGAVPAWQAAGCIQLAATTVCTPTGVPYLCGDA